MKLATYKDGSRDGQLVVVSRDLGTAHYATGIAAKLQQALDDWNFVAPQLQDLYDDLNQGKARHAFPFDPAQCMAPLPRAYQWADGSAYINHVELVRAARNSEVPKTFYTDPLMYQGGSDDFIGPLDEVADAWSHGRLNLTLQSTWNGRKVGMCDAGPEMTFHFGQLIAHICKTRNVRAGSIVGSGTVSNKGVEKSGKTEWPKGYSCIAEKRCIETIQDGQPSTEFMKYGDTIRIEMKGRDGQSVFGAIDQEVVAPAAAR